VRIWLRLLYLNINNLFSKCALLGACFMMKVKKKSVDYITAELIGLLEIAGIQK
jgi:hypothetical protein